MSNASSGAVFFLGTRAHYQVLDQPESQYDTINGNESSQTVYQNPSAQGMWTQYDNSTNGDNWNCCDGNGCVSYETDKTEPGMGVKRRIKRRQSEARLCEDEMKPAALNNVEDGDVPKQKPRRISLMSFLSSLARRKPRLEVEPTHLKHLESAMNTCTYRESCRCLDCQSRYFDCDDYESDFEYSDDSGFMNYASPDLESGRTMPDEEYDDEVFDQDIPEDNTSTDLLLDGREKMSISSDTLEPADDDEDMHLEPLEVTVGTPFVLNHLLTHPIACVIQ
ncbi:uncharacterized protein [Epargyreus clarus]|uniref:uncharacterized protein n=1 Tax=Epargyreus clarus TaxID=520877 RepID=UPI003C2AB852